MNEEKELSGLDKVVERAMKGEDIIFDIPREKEPSKYECECGHEFTNEDSYNEHQAMIHHINPFGHKREEKEPSKRAVKYYECLNCGDEWCMKELQAFKFLNENNHFAYKCPNCGRTSFYIYDSNERFSEKEPSNSENRLAIRYQSLDAVCKAYTKLKEEKKELIGKFIEKLTILKRQIDETLGTKWHPIDDLIDYYEEKRRDE